MVDMLPNQTIILVFFSQLIQLVTSTIAVMGHIVTVVGKRISDQSSNPGCVCLNLTLYKCF